MKITMLLSGLLLVAQFAKADSAQDYESYKKKWKSDHGNDPVEKCGS
jgi:hypothetical protein